MKTLVSEIDLPFIKNAPTREEQLLNARSLAKHSWLAKNKIGYTVLSYSDSQNILKDKRWHTALGLFAELNPNFTEEFKQKRKNGLLALNGEDHLRIKKLVMPSFSSSNVEKLRPFMRSSLNNLIDGLVNRNQADLQKEIFDIYPTLVICEILGIPQKDFNKFLEWTDFLSTVFDQFTNYTQEYIYNIQNDFNFYFLNLIENKRKNPSNDLLSQLIEAEEAGDKLSNEELLMLVEVIIASGIDTTRSQLGLCLVNLFNEKNKIDLLKTDHSTYVKIIDELIRLDTVLRGTARVASEDIVYNDILFPKGTIVFINIISSNYDNAQFANPDQINIQEENNKSLSFGAGIHYCLGAMLARAEIQESIMLILQRFEDLKIDKEVIYRSPYVLVNGLQSIPVSFNRIIEVAS